MAQQVDVRVADEFDISELVTIAARFVGEIRRGMTFNAGGAAATLAYYLDATHADVLIAEIDGMPCGSAIVCYDDDFHDERIGHLVKLYVLPERRNAGVGRALVRDAADWFDAKNCVVSYAAPMADIGEDGLFINACRKVGFEPRQPLLVRG